MKHEHGFIKYMGAAAVCILMLGGCAQGGGAGTQGQAPAGQTKQNTFILTGPGSYDSQDTATVSDRNMLENTISFYNAEVAKTYTLSFDGTTTLYDKHGQALSIDQVEEGDIVDITFLKEKKKLNSLKLSSLSWSNRAAEKYTFNTARHEVTVGNDVYKITDDTMIFSNGQKIEQMDLNEADVLTFNGIGSSVYSIVVDKGHGYLRLANDENFVGGWIEAGQSQIRQITEDMLLVLPEGRYDVLISHKGGGGTKNVIINREEEVTLDIGDLEVAQIQYGQVLFALNPSSASVYVDGEKVDASGPVTVQYGIHQLIVKADGYSSISTYMKVGQPSAGVEIELEKEGTVSSGDSGSSDTTISGNYKVYVNAPEGAEVYLNGNYVGIAPAGFTKKAGTHVITLRKSGYETRSYTVTIDSEQKDISYSFADLESSKE